MGSLQGHDTLRLEGNDGEEADFQDIAGDGETGEKSDPRARPFSDQAA